MGRGSGSALKQAPEEDSSAQARDAAEAFHRRFPSLSAKHVLSWAQFAALLALAAAGYAAVRYQWPTTASVLHALGFALFAITIASRLIAAAHLQPILSPLFSPSPGQAWPRYTILCPLRGEAAVVADLVAALSRLDYPGIW